jgi:hypothetical protein
MFFTTSFTQCSVFVEWLFAVRRDSLLRRVTHFANGETAGRSTCQLTEVHVRETSASSSLFWQSIPSRRPSIIERSVICVRTYVLIPSAISPILLARVIEILSKGTWSMLCNVAWYERNTITSPHNVYHLRPRGIVETPYPKRLQIGISVGTHHRPCPHVISCRVHQRSSNPLQSFSVDLRLRMHISSAEVRACSIQSLETLLNDLRSMSVKLRSSGHNTINSIKDWNSLSHRNNHQITCNDTVGSVPHWAHTIGSSLWIGIVTHWAIVRNIAIILVKTTSSCAHIINSLHKLALWATEISLNRSSQ